ncbi:MAG: alpha-glucosidase/alpha-galactosidase [Desulfurococcaceae archaeon]
MERIKVAFIGAGSAVWSSGVIVDLLIKDSLRNLDIWLMDIDEDRLATIYGFARRYVEELGRSDVRVYRTQNREEAVKDADFVINSAMAGGHWYYERMREVSERHGYYRGINSVEWNMVSDYHTIWGYYQFKLVLNLARDVEELADNSWLINVANPIFELSTLVTRKTKVKYIGLCHGHLGFLKAVKVLGIMLARERLGKDINEACAADAYECYLAVLNSINLGELEVEMSGFNHVIWLTKFKYSGEDAYGYFDEWTRTLSEEYIDTWRAYTYNPFDVDLSPAAIDMYREFGVLPVGDTVRGGTWKYHWDLKTKQYWYGPYGGPDSEIGWAMYLAHLTMKLRELREAVLDVTTPLTSKYAPRPSGESIAEIIDAIVNDKPKECYLLQLQIAGKVVRVPVPLQVNIPNLDAVPGVPGNVVVEIPVRIDGKGVHRKPLTPLPGKVMKRVILPRMMRMEWALSSFLEGGRDHLENWLLYDARTKNAKQVEDVIDAILNMPGNEEMKKHFS